MSDQPLSQSSGQPGLGAGAAKLFGPTPEDLSKISPTEKPKFKASMLQAAVDSYMDFTRGPDYDHDPERRYTREHGGHCSGGGGCS